ncbi:hypothetical protein MKEN_01239200 [Mycena kentingensis (nom. inval.)]|nr:hypothetical protein MKEN_01239200 [Mycena kentingensis (nom. inval.)]
MSTQLTDFPLELLEMVPGHVAVGADLKALSLTSSIFREPCQRILFSTITPKIIAPSRSPFNNHTYRVLNKRLDDMPHLVTYITTVILTLRRDDPRDHGCAPSMDALLGRLTHVRHIVLCGPTIPPGALIRPRQTIPDWDKVLLPLRTAALELVARLSTTGSGGSGTLRRIAIEYAANVSWSDIQLLLAAAPEVILDNLRPELEGFTRDLRRITLSCDEDSSAHELYAARSASIEHVRLRSNQPSSDAGPSQSLRDAAFPRLRHLEIVLAVRDLEHQTETTPVWLQFAAAFLRGSVLTTLTLELTLAFANDGDDPTQTYTRAAQQALSRLDQLIVGQSTLKSVCFSMQLTGHGQGTLASANAAAFQRAVRGVMMNTETKGILRTAKAPTPTPITLTMPVARGTPALGVVLEGSGGAGLVLLIWTTTTLSVLDGGGGDVKVLVMLAVTTSLRELAEGLLAFALEMLLDLDAEAEALLRRAELERREEDADFELALEELVAFFVSTGARKVLSTYREEVAPSVAAGSRNSARMVAVFIDATGQIWSRFWNER